MLPATEDRRSGRFGGWGPGGGRGVGAAVLALGLGLIAQQQGKAVDPANQAVEAIAPQVVAVLRLGDLDIRGEGRVLGEGGDSVTIVGAYLAT
jgi:hypothetical protein